MLNALSVPFLVGGIIVGAASFAPFPLVLGPVVSGKRSANMLKGFLSIVVSVAMLLMGTLLVYALFGLAFQTFLAGEAVGFLLCMVGFVVYIVRNI